MKKWIFTALAVSALVLPAAAFAGKGTLVKTFGSGEVTVSGGSATIKTHTVIDPVTDLPGFEYGGVYSKDGPKKAQLDQVTFKFTTDGHVQGGAPRWSIPIDTNKDQRVDGYAFLDAAGCGASVGTNKAKVVTVVSTDNPNCKVVFGDRQYDNWAKFAAENTNYRVAKKNIPFIIVDVAAGEFHVYDLQFG